MVVKMKLSAFAFWQFIALAIGLVCSPANSGQVNYLVNDTGAPYQIIDKQNALVGGIVTDVVKAIFNDSQHLLSARALPTKRIHAAMLSSSTPNWLVYHSPEWMTDKLLSVTEFSEIPLYSFEYSIITRKSHPITANNLQDLLGKRLLLIHGYFYKNLDPYLTEKKIFDERPKTHNQAVKMLHHGRGDAFLAHAPRIKLALEQTRLAQHDFDIQRFGHVIPPTAVYLGFDKKMPSELKAFINRRLIALQDSGELARILSRYGIHTETENEHKKIDGNGQPRGLTPNQKNAMPKSK